MGIRADIASVFELRPSPRRLPIAVQGAVAIGVPVVGLSLAGMPRLGLLAEHRRVPRPVPHGPQPA